MVNSVVGLWSSWIVAVTWQLAALALIALVCEKALRLRLRQPRVRHALWWFVLVAPLLLAPGRMALARRQAVVRVPAPAALERVVTVVRPPAPEPVAPAALRLSPPPATQHGWPPYSDPRPLVAVAWAIGCALMLTRLGVGHLRVRRMLGKSQPVEDEPALRVLAELLEAAGHTQAVKLRTSRSLGAPLLYGFRPTILLPTGWTESLSDDELRGLLAHEVAHVKRRDYLANFVQRLVEIPLFFHPGAWLASRGITLSREESADAWALARGADASSYARSLTAAAERAQVRVSVASVGVAEGRSTLLRRVEAIMQGVSLRRLSRPLVAALIGAALLSAGAFAAVQVRGNSDASVSGEVPLTAARSADLTASDTEAALQAAGIRMQRYDYDAPFPHYFTFTFEQYVDGRRVPEGGSSESQLGSRPDDVGRQSFLLTTRDEGQQDSRAIAFQFSNDAGSVGGRSFSLKGHDALSYGALPARLRLGEAVPIYALQANLAERGGIRGTGSDASVAYRISHYDMAIIVYAELTRETQTRTDATPAASSAGAEPRTASQEPGRALVAPIQFRAEEETPRFNETDIALNQAGIRAHRFTYFASSGHMLYLTVKVFRKGQLVDTIGGGGTGGSMTGPLQFLLFEHRTRGTISLSLAVGNDHGHTSIDPLRAISLEDIGTSNTFVSSQDLIPGEDCPIWVLAGDDQTRTKTSMETWDGNPRLERYIKKHDLVAVAYLRIEPMSGDSADRSARTSKR